MLQTTWIFMGLVATIATVLTLQTTDDQLAIVTGLLGAIAWLLWGYSALNVVVYDSGVHATYQYPSLAAFGVMMAIPNLFVALMGPLRIARDPRQLADQEVR